MPEAAEGLFLGEVGRVSAEELVVDDYERPEVVGRDLDIDEGVWNEAVGVVVVERDEDVVGGVAC